MAVIRKPADMELGVYLVRAREHFAGSLLPVKHIVLFSAYSIPVVYTPARNGNNDLCHLGLTSLSSDAVRWVMGDNSTTIRQRYPNYCSLEYYDESDDNAALMLIADDSLFRISVVHINDNFSASDLLDE